MEVPSWCRDFQPGHPDRKVLVMIIYCMHSLGLGVDILRLDWKTFFYPLQTGGFRSTSILLVPEGQFLCHAQGATGPCVAHPFGRGTTSEEQYTSSLGASSRKKSTKMGISLLAARLPKFNAQALAPGSS